MSKDKSNIEDIFKEAFDNYEVDPGSNTWKAIQSKIGAKAAASASGSAAGSTSAVGGSWIATSVIAVAISAAAIGGYFYFNESAEKLKQEKISQQTGSQPEQTNTVQERDKNKTTSSQPKQEKTIEAQNASSELEDNATNKLDKTPLSDKKVESEKDELSETKQEESKVQDFSKEEKQKNKNHRESGQEQIADEKNKATTAQDDVRQNREKSSSSSSGDDEQSKPKTAIAASGKNNQAKELQAKDVVKPTIYIPNVFSPNGDGTNDKWEITIDRFDAVSIKVFDKKSKLIYEAKSLDHPWEGKTMNDRIATEGLYFYKIIIEYNNESYRRTGNITIKR